MEDMVKSTSNKPNKTQRREPWEYCLRFTVHAAKLCKLSMLFSVPKYTSEIWCLGIPIEHLERVCAFTIPEEYPKSQPKHSYCGNIGRNRPFPDPHAITGQSPSTLYLLHKINNE